MNRSRRGIKEIRQAREKADAERRRMFERFSVHRTALDKERLAREAFLARIIRLEQADVA